MERTEVIFDGLEFEDNGLAGNAMGIRNPTLFISMEKSEFSKEPVWPAFPHALKNQQPLAALKVIDDGAVSPRELHIARLPFAIVMQDVFTIFVFPVVVVSVLCTGLASEQDDEGCIGGR